MFCKCCGAERPMIKTKRIKKNGEHVFISPSRDTCDSCNPYERGTEQYLVRARQISHAIAKVIYECPHQNPRKELHHFDYDHPEMVIRLCSKCHKAEHRRLAAQAAANTAVSSTSAHLLNSGDSTRIEIALTE